MEIQKTNDEIVQYIFADLIVEPPLAMRTEIDRDALWELADDIKANGLINPITVRPVTRCFTHNSNVADISEHRGECNIKGVYEVVAGHRRFLACRMAGILNIPCVVRVLDDSQLLGVMASENLVRADVDPVDEGIFIARLMREKNMDVAAVAQTIRRSRQYVEDRLVVANMPDYMHDFIKTGELKLGVALHLVGIEPDEKRRLWVGMAVEQNITVRTAEHWAYQHRIGTLPDVHFDGDGVSMNVPLEQRTPMFRCELDGQQYPMDDLKMLTYSSKYVPVINELAVALRSDPSETIPPSEPVAAAAPVGSGSSNGANWSEPMR